MNGLHHWVGNKDESTTDISRILDWYQKYWWCYICANYKLKQIIGLPWWSLSDCISSGTTTNQQIIGSFLYRHDNIVDVLEKIANLNIFLFSLRFSLSLHFYPTSLLFFTSFFTSSFYSFFTLIHDISMKNNDRHDYILIFIYILCYFLIPHYIYFITKR